jgi:hypothetical protein
MHADLEALRKELAKRKGGEPPERIGLPRSLDKSLVRYELPLDMRQLEGMSA